MTYFLTAECVLLACVSGLASAAFSLDAAVMVSLALDGGGLTTGTLVCRFIPSVGAPASTDAGFFPAALAVSCAGVDVVFFPVVEGVDLSVLLSEVFVDGLHAAAAAAAAVRGLLASVRITPALLPAVATIKSSQTFYHTPKMTYQKAHFSPYIMTPCSTKSKGN